MALQSVDSNILQSYMQVWCSGNILASQADVTGSNPATCFTLLVFLCSNNVLCVSSPKGLLIPSAMTDTYILY